MLNSTPSYPSSKNGHSFIFILLTLVAISIGEYYFLQVIPSDSKLYLLGLKFFTHAGLPIRILLVILYPLWFSMLEGKAVVTLRSTGKIISILIFTACAALLFTIHQNPFFYVGYPVGLVGVGITGYLLGQGLKRKQRSNADPTNIFTCDKSKKETPYSFHFKADDGWINILNPFRGILVIGSAGSGKSYSIAEPILAQAAKKNYSGIVYDFKFPTLTKAAYSTYKEAEANVSFWVLNFEDMTRTHRVNPLNPRYLPHSAYATEYAQAVINNLMPESIEDLSFWDRAGRSLLAATIWFLKKCYPAYCTFPHAVNMLLYRDFNKLIQLLESDHECASLIRPVLTAASLKADKQLSGMIGGIQLGIGQLNTPEICWVLSGEDFSMDINDSLDPKLLCIGTSPTLCETLSPVISLLITAALKQMNQQGKHHSMVMLDEAPTLFIPKLDQVPATARSNKVATIYMAQDLSQIRKENGKEEAESIVANLNNQFWGRVANLQTANYVSGLFGREDKLMRSESQSDSRPKVMSWDGKSNGSYGSSASYSLQERTVIHPQMLLQLPVGHFVGTIVESENPNFSAKIQTKPLRYEPIPVISTCKPNLKANYKRIIDEVEQIMAGKIAPLEESRIQINPVKEDLEDNHENLYDFPV